MPSNTPHGRLRRVLALYAAAALLLVLYVTRTTGGGRGFPCPLLLLTGLQCPLCGMTRAAASLLRLDFAAAFSYHALWPLAVAYFLWIAIADGAFYVRRGEARALPAPKWLHAVVLALVVIYGVVRNFLR